MALDIAKLKATLQRLEVLRDRLQARITQVRQIMGGNTGEVVAVADIWGSVKDYTAKLFEVNQSIDIHAENVKDGIPEHLKERVAENHERTLKRAENLLRQSSRFINKAEAELNSPLPKSDKKKKEDKDDKVREDKEEKDRMAKEQKEREKKEAEEAKKKEKDKPRAEPEKTKTSATTPAEKFEKITKEADRAVAKFNKQIPAIQKDTYDSLQEDLRKLDLQDGRIKTTVKNLSLINSIKNKLNRIILTDGYKSEVKDFAKSFNEIATLQNEYWKSINKDFKPRSILKAIREQAISDTVGKLTEAGIGANIAEPISDILRTNITTGGSYKKLTEQLRENLVNTQTPGTMEKYIGQITTDAVNQFSNQYTQLVSSDLGYEWFKYDNTDILTTRPFCDAMTDRPYFHISEVPALLRGEGLTYLDKKTGKREPVMIYEKTGLPSGMIPGTDASNFFIRRGGYRCGHSIRPVNERQVPQADKDRVFATAAYIAWKSANK